MPSASAWREFWRQSRWLVALSRYVKRLPNSRNLPKRPRRSKAQATRRSSDIFGKIMQNEGFFDHPEQRLLLFTEFRDTLDHLMEQLKAWGFSVGCIHGGMKPGSPRRTR